LDGIPHLLEQEASHPYTQYNVFFACNFFERGVKQIRLHEGTDGFMREKTRILIVEDDTPLAMLMITVLMRVGFEVEAAHSGKKALELATEYKFDLITLDIGLPDANGFEICSELKQRHISRHTPIIIVSANPLPGDMAEGTKRGAVDFITKPFDITDFIYKVIFHTKANAQQKTAFESMEVATDANAESFRRSENNFCAS
jgi:DNA-binding response OmpR family regulator